MISERTFLMKIFARKDASDDMREMIIKRCEELDEANVVQAFTSPVSRGTTMVPGEYPDRIVVNQSPSMQRLMQQNPDLIPKAPVPVTPAAAQALAARNALMNQGERPEPGRRSPRKA